MKKAILFVLTLIIGAVMLDGCMKKTEDTQQMAFREQLSRDEAEISKFIVANGITATRHESGVYYQVIETGEGNYAYTAQSNVEVKYIGRFLNGSVFDRTQEGKTVSFRLGNVILGWQIGMQLIQKGGKVRLIIPSGLAYGSAPPAGIPVNAILDFDIELIDIK